MLRGGVLVVVCLLFDWCVFGACVDRCVAFVVCWCVGCCLVFRSCAVVCCVLVVVGMLQDVVSCVLCVASVFLFVVIVRWCVVCCVLLTLCAVCFML